MTPARVLIVDGNAADAQATADALTKRGFVVEVAAEVESALAALERTRPDVVLLDVAGPATGGLEVLDRIRSNPQIASTPVIIVTAKASGDDVSAGYKFGADYYLTKPLTTRRLVRGIGLVLGREFPE